MTEVGRCESEEESALSTDSSPSARVAAEAVAAGGERVAAAVVDGMRGERNTDDGEEEDREEAESRMCAWRRAWRSEVDGGERESSLPEARRLA